MAKNLKKVGFYRYSLLNRGGDRIVVEYANYLASIGHTVTFFVCKNETVFDVSPRVSVEALNFRSKLCFLLYGFVRNFNQDLIVFDIIHLAPFLSFRNKVMYFAQAYDVEYYQSNLSRKVVDLLYKRYLKNDPEIVVVSKYLSDVFREKYNFKGCTVVTNGIDLSTFYQETDPQLLEVKGSRRAIVFMSRGDWFRKGYDIALELFSNLSDENLKVMELWVCGDSLEEGNYSFPVRNFGVVSDSRLREILSSADIFLYPSRHEGFGLFPLEAMACGCVVVTTDAIPYAKDVDSIQVAPIGDVDCLRDFVLSLLMNSEQLVVLKDRARRAVGSFDMEASQHRFASVVEEMLEG